MSSNSKSCYYIPRLNHLIYVLIAFGQSFFAEARQNPELTNQTWSEAKATGTGKVTVFWNDSPPFMSVNSNGQLWGIEYDILTQFKEYLKTTHQVDLQIEWKRKESFTEVYNSVRSSPNGNAFGTSGVSITEERKQEVSFGASYMADISVLVSSENVPVVKSVEEFARVFENLTAVTVKQSTFEQDLLKVKSSGNFNFPIKYLPSGEYILAAIQNADDLFGFIDLPIYLNLIKANPSAKIKRQNLFPKIRGGYSIISPLKSEWSDALNEYLQQSSFRKELPKIISRYLDMDLYNFIEGLSDPSGSQMALLIKEKEIQANHLREEIRIRNLGIALLVIISTSLIIIILLYRRSQRLLRRIEQQGRNIELQNAELEAKNKKLEEFTFANAHKLRAPVATILGLIQLIEFDNLRDDETIVSGLKGAAFNLDKETKEIRDRLEAEGWISQETNEVL